MEGTKAGTDGPPLFEFVVIVMGRCHPNARNNLRKMTELGIGQHLNDQMSNGSSTASVHLTMEHRLAGHVHRFAIPSVPDQFEVSVESIANDKATTGQMRMLWALIVRQWHSIQGMIPHIYVRFFAIFKFQLGQSRGPSEGFLQRTIIVRVSSQSNAIDGCGGGGRGRTEP